MSDTTLNDKLVEASGDCGVCHRNIRHRRLTLGFLLKDALANIFNVERGLLFTFIELYKNPKTVMDNFIAGDRYRYINPFRFLFTAATLYAIVVSFFGFSITEFMNIGDEEGLFEIQDVLSQYSDLMILANVPLIALGTLVAFRYAGLNYAEHLVVNAYAYSLMTLSQIPLEIVFSAFFTSLDPYWEIASGAFIILIIYIYISTFSKSIFWGILRSILAFLLSGFFTLILMTPFIIIAAIMDK